MLDHSSEKLSFLFGEKIKELDRTLLALTVDKIYIYENKQIKIHIRYQDMIEKMKVIRRFYAEHRTECRKEVG
jgi:site-specific DNA recombinase